MFLGGSSQGCCRLKWGSNGYFCKVQEIILGWRAEHRGIELIKEIIYLKLAPQCFRSCQVGRKCLLQLRDGPTAPLSNAPEAPNEFRRTNCTINKLCHHFKHFDLRSGRIPSVRVRRMVDSQGSCFWSWLGFNLALQSAFTWVILINLL